VKMEVLINILIIILIAWILALGERRCHRD